MILNCMIIRVHYGFSLVKNRDLLEDMYTINVIPVRSQSQPLQNFQQPMTFCVLYR